MKFLILIHERQLKYSLYKDNKFVVELVMFVFIQKLPSVPNY
jgi:hypothetical protein